MNDSRGWITVVLVTALPWAPCALQAQRIAPAGTARPPLLIQARGTATRASRGRAEASPQPLAAASQLSMARAAVGSRVPVSGIGAKLRLTPADPFAPSRGELRTNMAIAVEPDAAGGRITLQPDVVGSPGGPEVEVRFRPTEVNRPVLVDFVLKVSSVNAPVGVFLAGHGVKQHLSLGEGDQHVTALVLPGDTGWYTVSLMVDKTPKYQRVWVYAVELTTVN